MEYTYQQTINIDTGEINTNQIKRLPDNAIIPNDINNVDWIAYQQWLSDGNTPLPPN